MTDHTFVSMNRAVLGLGSNTAGKRATNLMAALNMIGRRIGRVAEVSNFYETLPYGANSGKCPYINAVAIVETKLRADEILPLLKEIEDSCGRDRTSDRHEISVDVDLVMWNSDILRPHEIDRDYFARGWKEVQGYV